MTDTDRLAALLHDEMRSRIGIPDPHPDTMAVDEPTCQLLAAHLIAAGVAFRDEIDVERLARAMDAANDVLHVTSLCVGDAAAIAREYAKETP